MTRMLTEEQCRTAFDRAAFRASGDPGAQAEADALHTALALYAMLREARVAA